MAMELLADLKRHSLNFCRARLADTLGGQGALAVLAAPGR